MTRAFVIAALAATLAEPAFAQQSSQTATADFIGKDGKETGRAALTAGKEGVLIEAEVTGLPPGTWVAFHVHETGKCDAAHGHESAGGHFNPGKTEHGFLAANGPHAGDMPNQYAGRDGVMRAQVFNSFVRLDDEKLGIRGRALMIHAKSDDNRSQPSGDAGERLACAPIK
ncbi:MULTISPECIES: superoxide dismutase family protein [unclassified Rhizobium]|uniref:superoxide dismutase family protein n=1 Tax=unclassified Rhizobium TaxID=2613769 RepID=UPI0006F76617|nr:MULTISPECIES: superoxide dismutase family protein [unclassified Rhizobium]KQV43438.1 superoxide dismutase [Rhizobium sp. Root1212]KRD37624.1 superoxide dismutase [Rhizobium sp. Root268]